MRFCAGTAELVIQKSMPPLSVLLSPPGWEGWVYKPLGTPQRWGTSHDYSTCPKRLGMCERGVMVNLALGCTQGTSQTLFWLSLPIWTCPASIKHCGRQTQGKKVNGPQLHCLGAAWQGMQRVLGMMPTPAAWRERGKGAITGITGSLPAQCQLGLH